MRHPLNKLTVQNDHLDSTDFLRANGKASDADLLDGRVTEYPWRYLPEDDVTISYAAVAAELRRR